MSDNERGVSRAGDDQPEQRGTTGGWWQADDGYWYPPPPPGGEDAATSSGTAAGRSLADALGANGEPITTPQPTVEGSWQADGGPPTPPPPPLAPPGERPSGLVGAIRSWPLWAKIAVPSVAVLIVVTAIAAALGPPEDGEDTAVAGEASTTTERVTTTERTTTTRPTTTRPSTTTTTAPPTTTTTAPPTTTTTVPPTTAPPPPPTTAAPQPQVQPKQQAPSCHPSYSGCVPIASDVDCAGGSGDGPEYVSGPINVIGPDEYGLDSDGDGVACES
jgi:hypothetical protein